MTEKWEWSDDDDILLGTIRSAVQADDGGVPSADMRWLVACMRASLLEIERLRGTTHMSTPAAPSHCAWCSRPLIEHGEEGCAPHRRAALESAGERGAPTIAERHRCVVCNAPLSKTCEDCCGVDGCGERPGHLDCHGWCDRDDPHPRPSGCRRKRAAIDAAVDVAKERS